MAVTYTWEINGVETKTEKGPEGNDRAKTVVQTRWTKKGTEGGKSGEFQGATPFSAATVADSDFVEFDSLTKTKVLNWIKAVVVNGYEEHVNEAIAAAIDKQVNPVTSESPSWVTEPVAAAPAPE